MRCHAQLGDPAIPLWVTEGIKKGDALASHGACVIALSGVDNWRGTNAQGGKTALADWEYVALDGRLVRIVFDSDTWRKAQIQRALRRLIAFLESRGASVEVVRLDDDADGSKQGADDFLLAHSLDELVERSTEPTRDNRQRIRADTPMVHEQVDEAWGAVLEQGSIFRRGGALVTVEETPDGAVEISALNEHGLLYHLSEHTRFFKRKQVTTPGGGQQWVEYDVPPPPTVAKIMANYSPGVPVLRRVASTPVFASTGRLIREAGYDPETGIWHAPVGHTPAIPDDPAAAQVAEARDLVMQAVGAFQLDGDASRAHAAALMFEPFVRLLIDGPTPLYLIEAATQGSGKGKLATVMAWPFLRSKVPARPSPTREEEFEKVITTAVAEGAGIFMIDNLKIDLASGALAAALTSEVWQGRILGASKTVTGPITWSWVVTANNPVVDNDIARRCIWVRIVTTVEEPWRLPPSAFPIPDIDAWVIEHEGALTAAVLTLAQAWIRAGMPEGRQVLGSYEAWAKVIGGIFDVAGIPGFLGNLDEFYDAANTERAAWRALVRAWWGAHGSEEVSTGELYALVERNGIDLRLGGKDDAGRRRSLGLKLKSQRDRVYDGFQLANPGNVAGGAKAWKLVPVHNDGPKPEMTSKTGMTESPLPQKTIEDDSNMGSKPVTPVTPDIRPQTGYGAMTSGPLPPDLPEPTTKRGAKK